MFKNPNHKNWAKDIKRLSYLDKEIDFDQFEIVNLIPHSTLLVCSNQNCPCAPVDVKGKMHGMNYV